MKSNRSRGIVIGFGSTYEGLKPALGLHVDPEEWCFGSTYEGLKLRDGIGAGFALPVLAVPMRA